MTVAKIKQLTNTDLPEAPEYDPTDEEEDDQISPHFKGKKTSSVSKCPKAINSSSRVQLFGHG